MQLKNLLNDDRAVSPVIGVILMVAITVILAAVIGTFVLGLGDSLNDQAPQATYDWSQDGDTAINVTIKHTGGDPIDPATVSATLSGVGSVNGDSTNWHGDEISAGDEWEISQDAESDDEITITWTAEDGGTSSVLNEYEVQ